MMTRQEKERIQYILARFLDNTASPEERQELAILLKSNTDDQQWLELLEEIYHSNDEASAYDEMEWRPVLEELLLAKREQEMPTIPHHKTRGFRWRPVAVAASILLLIGLGSYFLFFNNKVENNNIASEENKDIPAPVNNKATIKLANGNVVELDNASDGTLLEQGNIKLVKLADGQIAYQPLSSDGSGDISFHTLSNPRGSKVINIALEDGSRIWLNAGSSLTYPSAFPNNERKVSISGEAYFEVAHDAKRPFSVSKDEMNIQVLGTHFNVSAYDDDPLTKVTLLEGSVQVKTKEGTGMLKPTQQAVMKSITSSNGNNPIEIRNDVDVEAVMAWKNGLFQFGNIPISAALKQISRWYDVEITYEKDVPDIKLWGEMKRDLSLAQVLRGLGKLGMKFSIEGKKLTVKSQ